MTVRAGNYRITITVTQDGSIEIVIEPLPIANRNGSRTARILPYS
jgi:hypothetical protein